MADTEKTVQEILDQVVVDLNADESAKGLRSVVEINLTGEGGGIYHLAIKDGVCTVGEGSHASPNITMAMTAQDYIDIVVGKLNGQMAFKSGKLKIAGDMDLAMKMQALMFGPGPHSPGRGRPDTHGPGSGQPRAHGSGRGRPSKPRSRT
jgi:putative sterol carrier protein